MADCFSQIISKINEPVQCTYSIFKKIKSCCYHDIVDFCFSCLYTLGHRKAIRDNSLYLLEMSMYLQGEKPFYVTKDTRIFINFWAFKVMSLVLQFSKYGLRNYWVFFFIPRSSLRSKLF